MSQAYTHPEALVETDWVAAHLRDDNIRIVESDEDPLLYAIGHIPGSVQVDWFSTLQHPLRRDFLTKEKFEEVASRLGIKKNTTVVFYGDKSNWFAAYAFWLFGLRPVLAVVLVIAAALVISFLATLYPSRHASRLNPVEALRYE